MEMQHNKAVISRLLLAVLIAGAFCILKTDLASADISLPTGQNYYEYAALENPILNDDLSTAKPISVGKVATGGDELDIGIALNKFSAAVDIYVAIKYQTMWWYYKNNALYDLTQVSTDLRWKSLPAGEGLNTSILKLDKDTVDSLRQTYQDKFYIYALVLKEGASPDSELASGNYYLWQTSFSLEKKYKLTIKKEGSGSGDVTVSTGLSAQDSTTLTWSDLTGTADYAKDSQITLLAAAASNSSFTSWSGCDSEDKNNKTCTVKMDKDREVTATFDTAQSSPTNAKLTVKVTGSGTVTSSPSGIDCGSDCTETYDVGKSVTLTATPSGNFFTGTSTFTGWSGGGCSGTATTCTLTMDSDKEVTAVFTGSTESTTTTTGCTITLDSSQSSSVLSKGDTGSFSVSVSGSCTWEAKVNPTDAARVTITSGSSGTGNGTVKYKVTDTTGTGDAAIYIYVNSVVMKTYTVRLSVTTTASLKITKSGTGSGTVTASTGTISWLGNTGTYSGDSTVTLTATADAGSTFAGWSGGTCSGTTATCAVTVNGAITVTASFTSCVSSVSPTSQSFGASGGTGNVTVTTTDSSCQWTATESLDWVTITSGSSGTGSGTVSFTVSANTGADRSGTITIAGSTFTITQTGCITISPSSQSFAASGGTGSITVTATDSSCQWTAAESLDWLTITSGSSGTGSGTVSFTVSANTGSSRSGSITVAGSTFTVSQSGQQSSSSISFGSISSTTWSSFYTLNAIEEADTSSTTTTAPAPNYGRSAHFYKITTPSAGCSTKADIVAAGSPSMSTGNTNMVASDVDLGSETSWWGYYFKYFALDGSNPNNGTNDNMSKYVAAKTGVYSGTMKFGFSSSYEEERLTIEKVSGNVTFYIMAVGEGWGKKSSYRIMWSCI